MAQVLHKLKRLKGRSLDELRERSAQALKAYAERRGVSHAGRILSDEAFFKKFNAQATQHARLTTENLLEHLRTRKSPRFFKGFDDRLSTVSLIEKLSSSNVKALIAHAERIVEGRFDLLGFRGLSFGQPIDWHLEPVSGKRSPLLHWSRIDYLDAEVAGDKKIVWELNRHQYFVTLGRAYWLTGDERYARTFASHVESWIEQNPTKLGINWASSLEVAFRSISWLWAIHFFKDSESLTPALTLRLCKSLYAHARHLENYLSTYFSPNTHLTGEALGLFYLGTLLPELKEAARWREKGLRLLLAELERQVHEDGVYFEQASYYQRYTADFYTHLLILSECNGLDIRGRVTEKLTALMNHLMHITRPCGSTPLFGDDDGGRLISLDERAADDFRAALSNAAVLFKRPDYKFVAKGLAEETIWLLGAEGARVFESLEAQEPSQTSIGFKTGGYFVMRDGWAREANFMLVDCGPHGSLSCGHAHADALSFDLAARGRSVMVDAGTYTYTGSQTARDYFRGTSAHNTLTIDGASSSLQAGPFSWKEIAECSLRSWTTSKRFDYFSGSHQGYERLVEPARHTRSVLFLKKDYWIVSDLVETEGAHAYDLYFHLAPEVIVKMEEDGARVLIEENEQALLVLQVFGNEGRLITEDGWVSRQYGEREKAPVLRFTTQGKGAQHFYTFFVPHHVGRALPRIRRVESSVGDAFEVAQDDTRDLLLTANQEIRAGEALTDFEWAWLRFESGRLQEFVLINGRALSFGGEELLRASERISFISAQLCGEELRLGLEAGCEVELATLNARKVFVNDRDFDAAGAARVRVREGCVVTEAVAAEALV